MVGGAVLAGAPKVKPEAVDGAATEPKAGAGAGTGAEVLATGVLAEVAAGVPGKGLAAAGFEADFLWNE